MQNETQDTVTAASGKAVRGEGISLKRLPPAALLAALGAAVLNAIIYLVASELGLIPRSVLISAPGGGQPLTMALVLIGSVAGAIGAAMVFALVGALARRPVRMFRIVAAVVLVLSFASPLTIPGAPLSMVLSLELMHVAAWAVIVWLLTTLARRTGPAAARSG